MQVGLLVTIYPIYPSNHLNHLVVRTHLLIHILAPSIRCANYVIIQLVMYMVYVKIGN